ncbi:MAG: hypothetical protein KGH58_03570 [Candidatus Micrarchaeota archaeon]|nr:hypothetical protein [Candidatus Micrarchaeota archaeon]
MFGLRFHRKREEAPASGGRQRPRLEHHERIRVYAAITGVLVILALASLLLSIHGSGRGNCGGIVLSEPRDSCYLAMANYTMDATLCGYVSSTALQAGCVSAIALHKANATLCSELSNTSQYYYGQCVSQVVMADGNPQQCGILPAPYASQCAYSFASAQGFSDNATCSYITNSTQLALCSGMHYYAAAVAQAHPAYCAQLPDYTDSAMIGAMLQLGQGNYSQQIQQVQLAGLNITPQGYCYYRLASMTSNYSLCSSQPGMLGQLCTYASSTSNQTASASLNASSCSAVPQQIRGVCTYAVLIDTALTTMNLSVCSQISDTSYRYSCISAYAARYNSTACLQIPNATYRQSCYSGASANATATTSP